MAKGKFSFGSHPKMLEVPLGGKAVFKFTGQPDLVETEWGEKYSFPISLLSHDSYESFPIKCNWETKSLVGKELYEACKTSNEKLEPKGFSFAYKESEWTLTRFDNGSYWIDSA